WRSTSMNDRDAMRLAARRAALQASIRDGNAQAAARAAARLRVPGARLTAQEITFARDTRAALGRALIAARLPRPAPPPAPAPELVAPRAIPWKRLAIALAVVSGLIFLVLGPGGEPGGKPEGDASAAVPDVTRPQVLAQVSRGRRWRGWCRRVRERRGWGWWWHRHRDRTRSHLAADAASDDDSASAATWL